MSRLVNRLLSYGGPAAALVILAAACSSSPSGGSSSASSSLAASGKGTVGIMVISIGPNAPAALSGAEFPDVNTAITAAVDAANARGGVNGKLLKLEFCYDQGDPNLSASCARQAVSDHDAVVMTPVELNADSILPILAPAHIPYFGNLPLSPDDFTSPDSFPLAGGLPADYGGVGVLLATHGCKKIGVIYNSQVNTEAGLPFIDQGATANGAKVVASVGLAAGSTTVSPQVAEVESKGADCIAVAIDPNQGPPVVQAVRQSGKNVTVGGITGSFPNSLLATLGSAGNGILLSGGEALPSDTSIPQIAQMLATCKRYEPNSPQPSSAYAVLGWADAQILINNVLPAVKGAVTGSSVTAAIQQLKNATTGVIGPYTADLKAPLPNYPRLKNYGAQFYRVENGVPQLISKGFVDLAPSLTQ
jgi:ABC-type branched-subunit amino acid transport system substrate-binding protein